MTALIVEAEKRLLVPYGLSTSDLENVLGHVMGHHVDSGDLYFQHHVAEGYGLEDGIVRDAHYSVDQGVGIRAICGEKTGFAYSDELHKDALLSAATAARSIAGATSPKPIGILSKKSLMPLYPNQNPILSAQPKDKIALLQSIDVFCRKQDARVKQVQVSLSGSYETILIVATDGTFAADIRPLVRLNVTVVVEEGENRETGTAGGGARSGYEYFLQDEKYLEYAKEAVRVALVNLSAQEAPAGSMPVVLGAGWPGVLLHEAVGHGLEGDFNRKGTSTYANRIGERVASHLCTIVDDGTLLGRRGSLTIDDEGTPTARNMLIENGILKGYLQDKLNAKLMGTKSTGNGRRESYSHTVMPRMTNTFMLPGPHTAEEMIASVKRGIYAVNFGGGQVDITSGKFVFSASEAYMIENGKVTYPVKGATLIGNGPEVMNKVKMVGADLQLDSGIGTCGKDGQSVPVGVGQPTLLISEMTVGGTRA